MLDEDYLRKAIHCSPLLPAPGNVEVKKIAESHLQCLQELDHWRETCEALVRTVPYGVQEFIDLVAEVSAELRGERCGDG